MKPGEQIVELTQADFVANNPQAIAAARLLIAETMNVNTPASDKQVRDYTADLHPTSMHYVIMRQQRVIAAAWARHNLRGNTYLRAIAVDPNERSSDQHYGSELMGYVAQTAIDHSDSHIDLSALPSSGHFFQSLGFTYIQQRSRDMRATPETVQRRLRSKHP